MVQIIADVGSNFKGSLKKAKLYIEMCRDIEVDIVKFQTYDADSLFASAHPAYSIIKENIFGILPDWHRELKETADEFGIEFCTTPTAFEHIDSLEEIGVSRYKIASGDLTFLPLIEKAAQTGKPIILSTGMATLQEVEQAVDTAIKTGNQNISLLHCVSNYPPEYKDVNLNAIKSLKQQFKLPVGFSDHTNSDELSLAAVALGADIIEKHIVMERIQKTPDAPFSMTPDTFQIMIDKIRNLEKALGNGVKHYAENEKEERYYARRGIYAACDIPKGTIITLAHLKFLRPAEGINAENFKSIIGKKTSEAIQNGDPFKTDIFLT